MYKYRLYFILGSMALLQSKSYGINVIITKLHSVCRGRCRWVYILNLRVSNAHFQIIPVKLIPPKQYLPYANSQRFPSLLYCKISILFHNFKVPFLIIDVTNSLLMFT